MIVDARVRHLCAVLALLGVLARPTEAIEPATIESEIKARMLSGAASEIHLLQAPPERVAVWREGADAGDPACQWLIGRCHDFGFTVPKNPAEAASWYRKAADQGYARAQLSLGHKLAAGKGVAKDLDEAVRLYQKAADQPFCPEAYEWLIQAYLRGYGVPKDLVRVKQLAPRAIAAYQKLADQGYAGARMRLARIYTTGTWGTPIDIEKGLAFYRQGLEQGHVYCQLNLGEAYVNGEYGLPKDLAQGVRLIRLAAAQGDSISRRNLVEMYLDGTIPDPDPSEADRLYAAVAPALRAEAEKDASAMYRLAQLTERAPACPGTTPRPSPSTARRRTRARHRPPSPWPIATRPAAVFQRIRTKRRGCETGPGSRRLVNEAKDGSDRWFGPSSGGPFHRGVGGGGGSGIGIGADQLVEPGEHLSPHVADVGRRLEDVPLAPVSDKAGPPPQTLEADVELLGLLDRDEVGIAVDHQ